MDYHGVGAKSMAVHVPTNIIVLTDPTAATHLMISGGKPAHMHPFTVPKDPPKNRAAPSIQLIKATGPDKVGVTNKMIRNTMISFIF
jgi:hypothetical protein